MSAPPPGFLPGQVRPVGQRPADTEVTETTKIPWGRVFSWLKPYWGAEALLMLAMTLGIALSLVYPLLMRSIVDDVIDAGRRELLWPLTFGIFGATALGMFLSGGAGWLQTWVTSRVLVDLRVQAFRHLQALGPAYFSRRRLGDILSRMGGDIAELQRVATGTLLQVVGSLLTLVGVISALTWLQPILLLIGAAFVPAALILLRIMRPIVRRFSLRIRERSADVSHHLLESMTALRTVRAHGLEDREAARFGAHNEALVKQVLGYKLWDATSAGAFRLLVVANLLAVMVAGVFLMDEGKMSFGDLIAFSLFQQRLYGPLQGLAGTYLNLQRAAASIARVFEILDAKPPAESSGGDARPSGRLRGEVAFSNVHFAYGPERPVLRGLDLVVKPDATTVVVGPSGVGKSTLIDLLFGFQRPQSGAVTLDGVSLADLAPDAWRGSVALVSQEPALFGGSLRDNLRWLQPSAPDDALWSHLQAVGLSEWARSLPQGLDTELGDRAVRLSQGQRQRIGLARALLREPTLLVLDEVTAALDWESDKLVVQAIERRRAAGGTTLVVSHRLSLAAVADTVVVLDDGTVAAEGTHDELLAGGGMYARLWALQTGAGGGAPQGVPGPQEPGSTRQ